MKRKVSLLLCAVFIASFIPMNTVFADKVLSWIVEPSMVYDNIYEFEDGLAGVRRGGDEVRVEGANGHNSYYNNYHGVINDQGKEIIPCSPDNPKYSRGSYMGGGYAWKCVDGNTDIYNYDGDIVLTLPYEDIQYLDKNIFFAQNDASFALIDIKGNTIISETKKYERCSVSKWGNSLIRVNQRNADYTDGISILYDYSGNIVLDNLDTIGSFYDYNKNTYTYYVQRNGKYALIDMDAHLITDLEYDSIEKTSEGTIRLTKDGKYGVADMGGNVIIPCEYDSIEQFKSTSNIAIANCYKVSKDGMYGLINSKTNTLIVPIEYDYVLTYDNTGAIIQCAKGPGPFFCPCDYRSLDGDIIYQNESDYPATVKKIGDDYYQTPEGIKDKYGTYILDIATNPAWMLDDNNIFIPLIGYPPEMMILNIEKNELEWLPYNDYNNLGEIGIVSVSNDEGLWGCIDANQNTIIPFEYEYISPISNNTFLSIQKNGKSGIADYDGNILIPCEYDMLYAEYFWGSYSKYKIEGTKDGKTYYGWIDENNKLVVPCEYESISKTLRGYEVKKDGKYGFIDLNGKTLFEPEYDDTYYQFPFLDENHIGFIKDGKYGILQTNTGKTLPAIYDMVRSCGENRFLVSLNGKYGIINGEGDVLLPLEYDYEGNRIYTHEYNNSYFCDMDKDTDGDGNADVFGLADCNGNIIFDCEYSTVPYWDNGLFVVCDKNGLWGLARYEEKRPVEVSATNVDGSLQLSLKNPDNLSGKVIAAFYKDDLFISMEQYDLAAGTSTERAAIPDNAGSYKIFTWESIETMKPLSKVCEGNINSSLAISLASLTNKTYDNNYCGANYEKAYITINGNNYDVYKGGRVPMISLSDLHEATAAEANTDINNDTLSIINGDLKVIIGKEYLFQAKDGDITQINCIPENAGEIYVPLDVINYLFNSWDITYDDDNNIVISL